MGVLLLNSDNRSAAVRTAHRRFSADRAAANLISQRLHRQLLYVAKASWSTVWFMDVDLCCDCRSEARSIYIYVCSLSVSGFCLLASST